MDDCNCQKCENRRALAESIKQLKKELPKPEYDWEDLERQDRKRKLQENINRFCSALEKDSADSYKVLGRALAEPLISVFRGEHVQKEDKEEEAHHMDRQDQKP